MNELGFIASEIYLKKKKATKRRFSILVISFNEKSVA